MTRWSLLALILFTALLPLGAYAQQNPPAAAAPAAPPPAQPGQDLVVAKVSGQPITEKEVLTRIELLSRQTMIKPEQRNQRNMLLFKNAVDSLITVTVLKGEAKKQNVVADTAAVDEQLQQAAKRYPSREEFEKFLASQGMTEAEARKSLEESLSIQKLLDNAVKGVPPTSSEEIQKFYDTNAERFSAPERAHVAQLFMKADPKSTPEQKAEIKKKIEEVRAEIESKKITFAEAVAKYSQDGPSAPKDGDVGFVTRNQIQIKPLEEAIFAASADTMTPVVEGPQGFHLIRVIEIKPAGKLTFDEVKPTIQQQLDRAAKQKAAQQYMQELRSKAVIENFMTAEEFDKRHPVQ